MKKSFLFFFVFALLFVLGLDFDAMALSTPFDRQVIDDDSHDILGMSNKKIPASEQHGYLDMNQVSYFSDGKTLEFSIWLRENLTPRDFPKPVTYGVRIDSDLNKETGWWGGFDYSLEISFNSDGEPRSALWENVDANARQGEFRTVSTEHKISYEPGLLRGGIISGSLNLSEAGNFPDHYRLYFFSAEEYRDNHPDFQHDLTRIEEVPPGKFTLTSNPPSITLKPGEEDQFEITIETNSALEHEAVISDEGIEDNKLDLNLKFNKITIPENSFITIPVGIKATQNMEPGYYTIPITVTLEESNAKLPYIDETSAHLTESTINLKKIILRDPLIITVAEPISWNEQISDFNEVWGLYIELIVGIIIGGLGALLIKKFKKKKTD